MFNTSHSYEECMGGWGVKLDMGVCVWVSTLLANDFVTKDHSILSLSLALPPLKMTHPHTHIFVHKFLSK